MKLVHRKKGLTEKEVTGTVQGGIVIQDEQRKRRKNWPGRCPHNRDREMCVRKDCEPKRGRMF